MKKFNLLLFICLIPLVTAQENYPPAYPREGAIKLLENDQVIVWNISWLKQQYPVHRHRYAHTGVYYSSGDRIITSEEGEAREIHTDAWNISFQAAGITHTETGISDEPLRAVFVQIKRPAPYTNQAEATLPLFPQDSPLDRRSNDRVRVWEYNGDLLENFIAGGGELQQHGHDAVVVWFDTQTRPNVHFIARGEIHRNLVPTQATRVFVFEIL